MDVDDDEAFLYGESPVPETLPPAAPTRPHATGPPSAVNTTLANTSTDVAGNSAGVKSNTTDGVSLLSDDGANKEAKGNSALEASIAATLLSQGIAIHTPFHTIAAQSAQRDPASTSPILSRQYQSQSGSQYQTQAGPSNGNGYAPGQGVGGGQAEEYEEEYEDDEEESDDDLDIVVNAPNKYNVDFRNPQGRQQAPNMVVSGMGLTAAALAKPVLAQTTTPISNAATISAPPAFGSTANAQQSGPQPVAGQGQAQAGNVLAAPRPLESEPPINVGSPMGEAGQGQAQQIDPSQMIVNGINPLPLLPTSTLPPAHAASNAPTVPDFPLLEPPLIKDGQTIYDFDIRSFEGSGQPWRRRGADLSRWFNYGFDEDSWVRYLKYRKRMVQGVEGLNSLPPGSMLPPNIADMLNIPQQNGMNGMPGMDMMGMANGMGGFPGGNPEQMQQMMMQMMAGAGGGAGGNMMDMGSMMGMPGMQGLPNLAGMGGMSPATNPMMGMPGMQGVTAAGAAIEEGSEAGALAGPPGSIGGGTPFNPNAMAPNAMMGMMPGFNPNVGVPNQVMGAPVGPGAFRGNMRGRGFVRGAAPLRGRGGMPLPTGPRAAAAGPIANIPTGPRAQRVQRDRDHLGPSEIELDYGGGDFPTPAEAAGKSRKSESTDRRSGQGGKESNLDEFGRAKRDESEERDPRDADRDRDSSYSPPPRARRDSRSPERRTNKATDDGRSDGEDVRPRESMSEADGPSTALLEDDGKTASPTKVEGKKDESKRPSSAREKGSRSSHHRSDRDKEHRSDRHRSSRDDDKYRSSRDKEKDKEKDKDKDKDTYRSSRDGGSRRSSRSRERDSRDKTKDGTREHRSSGTTTRRERRSRDREHRSSKGHTSSSSKRESADKSKDDRESDVGSTTERRRDSKDEDTSRKRSRSPSADRDAEMTRATRSKKR